MKTSLLNRRRTLLIREAINILILSIIVLVLINPSQASFAKQQSFEQKSTKQTTDQQNLIKQGFKDFCFFYYHDGNDPEENQDTRVCQRLSSAFASHLLNDAPVGSKQWPIQLSLHDLAQKNLLNNGQTEAPVTTQQDFVSTIKNQDLLALIGGGGNGNKQIPKDSEFLPTLWDFKFASGTTPNPSGISSNTPPPPLQTTPPSQTNPPPVVLPKINVTCRLVATTLTCTETPA
jgi:hypothetical protein